MTKAGSPGSKCCSEKIRTDTKNSVGISWAMRLARKFSMAELPAWLSFQLQSDHADQPIRHLLVTLKLAGVGDQDRAMVEIDDRQICQQDFGELFVDRLALCRVDDQTS